VDGLINLCKPRGLSSAKALYRVRKITRQRKSGHAGTLDPAADGVLVICLGRGTKLVEALMDQPKVYRAQARLDVTSQSHDAERPLQPIEVAQPPDRQRLMQVCLSFEGEIHQVPPASSALKVGGRPAYKLERNGQPPVLSARRVRIYWLHVHSYDWPVLDFELACGRGTYVRALIRDLGAKLGTGGCLTTLTRQAVGPFRLEEAWSLDRLETAGEPDRYLIELARAKELLSTTPPSIPPRPTTLEDAGPDRT
jgi:tRNA pseudouridine55 synthase